MCCLYVGNHWTDADRKGLLPKSFANGLLQLRIYFDSCRLGILHKLHRLLVLFGHEVNVDEIVVSLFVLGIFIDLPYTAAMFFSTGGAIITGLPGIIIQLLLIPIIVAAVKRHRQA